jgi:hypothetical protein
MRVSKLSIGDEVKVRDKVGDWIGKIISKCPGKSCFNIRDANPDGKEIWHQVKGGGARKEQYINGYRGEMFQVKARDVIEIVGY